MAADLRRLMSGTDAGTLQRRARLEAEAAVRDSSSRDWITAQVLRGQSPQVASTAVTSFGRAASGAQLDGGILEWLTRLLPSKHMEAARSVAAQIKDERLFGDNVLRSATAIVPVAVARLRIATEKAEASLLIRTLVELLVRIHRASPLPLGVINEVFELICLRLEPSPGTVPKEKRSDQFAAVTDLRILVGQVMAQYLPDHEVRSKLGEVLLKLQDDQVQSNVRGTLVVLLKGLGHDDLPNTCTWMRDIFSTPGVAAGLQLAIAEAVLDLDGAEPGGRAAALEQESNCPIAVATYLQKHIKR